MSSTACRSREGEEEADGKTKEAQRAARERDEGGRGRRKRRTRASSESGRQEEKEAKRRRWLTAPAVRCLACVAHGERAGHVGEHCREHDEYSVAAVGPHGRPFTEGTESEKREKRQNEIVDDSLRTLYRLERICWAHCWLSVDWLRRTLCSPLYQQDRHSSRYVSHRGPCVSLG